MALKEARLAVRAAVKRVEVAERENRIKCAARLLFPVACD
jgi:hypothetical protein